MEVRLLGPVGLWHAGHELPLARSHRRCLLAVLAMTPGRPVSAASLIDRVWGDRPARAVSHSLHTHVSALRRALREAGNEAVLRHHGGSYQLDIDPDLVDLHRARRRARQARQLTDNGSEPDQRALTRLREACALWRGNPLGGLAGGWADNTRAGLEQERLALLTERYRVELRHGHHAEVIGDLAALCAEHPLVEPLAAIRMLALYRCGRQAEALAEYARLRELLIAEIGDEPGIDLRQLHAQILRRDPELASPTTATAVDPAAATPMPVRPAQLPPDAAAFSGRKQHLAELDALLEAPGAAAVVISAVDGVGGIGKTALALHWAHRVRDRFPDGQLYVNLLGHSPGAPLPPVEALGRFLHALGLPAASIPADLARATATFRSILADRRMLLILDDVADADQIRPLLPGGGGSFVLVTSRSRLDGLVAREGARRLSLDVLAPEDAQVLLSRIIGADRIAAEPDAATTLAQLCGQLPLALRIAAAHLAARPSHRIADFVTRLRDRDRLATLTVPGDTGSSVAAAFDLSYQRLPEPARRMFRLLGLVPGPDVTAGAAAALADQPVAEAAGLLEVLTGAHLLEEHTAGRYSSHDLLRLYASGLAERTDPEPARRAALERLYGFYLATADAAARLLYPEKLRLPVPEAHLGRGEPLPDHATAVAWLEAEMPGLIAAVRHAATAGPAPMTWLLASTLRGYFWMRRGVVDWLALGEAARAAADASGDPFARAACHLNLGDAHTAAGEDEQAADHYRQAVAWAERAGSTDALSAALNNLGVLCARLGNPHEAARHFEAAIELNQRVGDRSGEAIQLGNLGEVARNLGDLERSVELHGRALAIQRELGHLAVVTTELRELAATCHELGQYDDAYRHLRAALAALETVSDPVNELEVRLLVVALERDRGAPDPRAAGELLSTAKRFGDPALEAQCRHLLGTIHRRLGDLDAAATAHRQALRSARELKLRELAAKTLIELAATRHQAGDAAQAEAAVGEAIELIDAAGLRVLRGRALRLAAELRLAAGDPAGADQLAGQAMELHCEIGQRPGEAETAWTLGLIRAAVADIAAARRHWQRAYELYSELGVPQAAEVKALLAG